MPAFDDPRSNAADAPAPARRAADRRRDVLCVHGMTAGGWIWEEAVAPRLEQAGHRVHAIDLPREAERASLAVYRDAVGEAMARTGPETVVVAHSLGGAAVQAALAKGAEAAGVALLASVPPYGLWRASLEMAVRRPRLWHELATMGAFGFDRVDMGVMRRHLFPAGIERDAFEAFVARAADEPAQVLRDTFGWPPFALPARPQVPMLVAGGTEDHFVPPTDVRLTAAWYGVRAHIVRGAGHMLMSGREGPQTGAMLAGWIARLPAPASAA